MAESFKFELVSPERLLVSASVTAVVIPGVEGEMTVMANHAPTMTTIKPGVVSVTTASGETERYVVFGGFADIVPSGCTVLAESAVLVKDANASMLTKRIEAARAHLVAAVEDEQRQKAQEFLDQLSALHGTVVPA